MSGCLGMGGELGGEGAGGRRRSWGEEEELGGGRRER